MGQPPGGKYQNWVWNPSTESWVDNGFASSTTSGFMTSADKIKLDALSAAAAPAATILALQSVLAQNNDIYNVKNYSIDNDYGGGEFQLNTTVPTSATITDATNATPIVITTSTDHGLTTGQRVMIAGVTGNTAANGQFWITSLTSTTFSLQQLTSFTTDITGNGNYVSGGVIGNGGTIIPSSVLSGRWIRNIGLEYINAAWFGLENSTGYRGSSIQGAVDFAAAVNIEKVIIPHSTVDATSTYNLQKAVVITDLANLEGVGNPTLYLSGVGVQTFYEAKEYVLHITQTSQTKNIVIEGITIDRGSNIAAGQRSVASGVYYAGDAQSDITVIFDNISIKQVSFNGIYIRKGKNVKVQNCNFAVIGKMAVVIAPDSVLLDPYDSTTLVSDCSITNCTVDTIGPTLSNGAVGYNITNATNATPIVITTDGSNVFVNGSTVIIDNIVGNTAANGVFRVNNIGTNGPNTFELQDLFTQANISGNGNYVSGGSIRYIEPGTNNAQAVAPTFAAGFNMQSVIKSTFTNNFLRSVFGGAIRFEFGNATINTNNRPFIIIAQANTVEITQQSASTSCSGFACSAYLDTAINITDNIIYGVGVTTGITSGGGVIVSSNDPALYSPKQNKIDLNIDNNIIKNIPSLGIWVRSQNINVLKITNNIIHDVLLPSPSTPRAIITSPVAWRQPYYRSQVPNFVLVDNNTIIDSGYIELYTGSTTFLTNNIIKQTDPNSAPFASSPFSIVVSSTLTHIGRFIRKNNTFEGAITNIALYNPTIGSTKPTFNAFWNAGDILEADLPTGTSNTGYICTTTGLSTTWVPVLATTTVGSENIFVNDIRKIVQSYTISITGTTFQTLATTRIQNILADGHTKLASNGTTTATSATIPITDTTNIAVGQYISVGTATFGGGKLVSKVLSITPTILPAGDVVVEDTADNSVTGTTYITSGIVSVSEAADSSVSLGSLTVPQVVFRAINPADLTTTAPIDASYVVLNTTGSLQNERALTAGTGLTLTDDGANGNVTLGINNNVVATISGSTFTGQTKHTSLTFSDNIAAATSPASNGTIRLANNTGITWRNAANSANACGIYADTSNQLILGQSAAGDLPPLIYFRIQTLGSAVAISTSSLTTWAPAITFQPTPTNPTILQIASATDTAASTLTVEAQSAWTSATTNKDGGILLLRGGRRTNTTGRRGGLRLYIDTSLQLMLEIADVQAEATSPSRVISLLKETPISTTQMPTGTGDKVLFISDAAVAPTVNSAFGSLLYSESSILKTRDLGFITSLSSPAGYIALGATTANQGAIRLANNTEIAWRNAANSANVGGIFVDASNQLSIGRTIAGVDAQSILLRASNKTEFYSGATAFASAGTTQGYGFVTYNGYGYSLTATVSDPRIGCTIQSTDIVTRTLVINGQPANATAVNFKDGGFINIQGGARTDNLGKKGGVRLQLNQSTTDTLIEVGEIFPTNSYVSRYVALCWGATSPTSTNLPANSGDKIVALGPADWSGGTPVSPVGCSIFWGDPTTFTTKFRNPAGTIVEMDFGTPASIATSNTIGTATTLARSDHQHVPIFGATASGPRFGQDDRVSDTAPQPLTFRAQTAMAGATTQASRSGGTSRIQGGARASSSGLKGGVQLSLNGDFSDSMFEIGEIQPTATSPSRYIGLGWSTSPTTTNLPTGTGDKVVSLAPAATAPTANPVGNSIIWGDPTNHTVRFRNPAGTVVEMEFGTPNSVGTANSAGTSTTLSRSDHVHSHGAQTDGTHHAIATTSVAGFLSATDKTKLDSVTTGAEPSKFRQTVFLDITADTTTTSTTFVTFMSQVINVAANSNIRILFTTSASNTSNNSSVFFRLSVDGTPKRGVGITSTGGGGTAASTTISWREANVSAGNHTVLIEWKVNSGTGQVQPVTTPDAESASLMIDETTT